MKYKYTATTAAGKKTKGVMEANGESDLYEKLRQQELYMISCSEGKVRSNKMRIKAKPLAEFSRQIGTLLAAGVSLVRALAIVAGDELTKPKYRDVYNKVLASVRQGVTLSTAMEEQGEAFPELLINMYRSAETSGDLDKVAMRMADHYDKESRMKTKVKNAMTYPIILLVLIVAVVLVLFTFVIPQFGELFGEMEELPVLTKFVMGLSDVIVKRWYLIIIGVVLLVLLIRAIAAIPAVRFQLDRLKIHLPIFGKLLKVIYTARFARTLSSLYSAGLPIVVALPIASATIGNAYIEAQFEEAIASVRRGENLSTSLMGIEGFIQKLASAIMVGEETGSLDTMLDSIADELDYESQMAISRMLTFLEPAMIIIMAIIVGVIIISVIMPLYGSYGAIENSAV